MVQHRAWNLPRRVLQIARSEGLLAVLIGAGSRLRSMFGRKYPGERARSHVPTMLRREEQAFLCDLAAHAYRGEGAIVDLGCWLGGSTAPLAQGLEQNERASTRRRGVDAYDSFRWNAWMAQTYRNTPLAHLRIDSSFLPEFEENVRPWKDRIRIHAEDVTETKWIDGPIEILFIDAMKSWDLANAIVNQFFPSLRAGLSTVVHQDFVHWNTPWILLLTYRFRAWLQPAQWIPRTSSYVFRCVSDPPADACRERYNFGSFPEEEVEEAFAYCRRLVPRAARANLVAAHLAYQTYRGRLERARTLLGESIARGWAPGSALRRIEPRIRQVETLRRLLQSREPLGAPEVSKRGFLSEREASLALADLAALGYVSIGTGSAASSYVATAAGRAWIDRSFDKAGLGVS